MEKRIDILDGLRGLAVSAVILQHLIEPFPLMRDAAAGPVGHILQNYFNLGRVGVIVFFLISGYLIPFTLKEGPSAVRSFWVSRFFRLYPLYWVSILVALAVFSVWPQIYPLTLKDVVLNFTMFQSAFGAENVLDPYWTLFIELIFYIFCVVAFVVKLGRPRQPLYFVMLLSAIVAAASVLSMNAHLPQGPLNKISTFGLYLLIMFMGSYLRALELGQIVRWTWCLVVPALAVALATYTVARYGADYNPRLSPISVLISTCAGIAIFMLRKTISGLLRQQWLVFIGVISYGLYLFHPITLHVFHNLLPHTDSLGDFAMLSVSVVVSAILLSWLGHRLVETPMIEIGKRVRNRLNETRTPVVKPESAK